MTILYLLVPLALVLTSAAVAAFVWTVRSGQLDDVETPPLRILFEDERAAPARPVRSIDRAKLAGPDVPAKILREPR